MHAMVKPLRSAGLPLPIIGGLGLAVVSVVAFTTLLVSRPQLTGNTDDVRLLNHILLWESLLPRAAIALICGAALGLSGALLQRVLRNPIADASTLGIAAGAQLAMTLAVGVFPLLLGFSREIVAFAGGLAAMALVVALSWRRGLDPVTVALSGMIITLIAAALSVAIILARGDYAMSIFIWGAGALNQQNWDSVIALAPQLAVGLALTFVLLRPLKVMGLDDSGAKALGLALHASRFAILVLAVWLSAAVTAEVGIIGFLGFAAPTIARLLGAHRLGSLMLVSTLTGAGLLFLTDCAVQLLSPGFSDLAPTGAATALLGGPLLLLLLPKLHSVNAARLHTTPSPRGALSRPGLTLAILPILLLLLMFFVLIVGRSPDGWQIASGTAFADLFPFRAPRTIVAASAGAMLAAAGFIMQRLTGNPIASPEVFGVSAGGGAGLTAALFLFAFPSPLVMMAAMAIGALVAFLIILAISANSGFGPERLLLAGVAMGALSMAIVTMVMAKGDLRGFMLLTWLSGSTNRVGGLEAWTAMTGMVVLIAPLPFFARWFAILPLGRGASLGLGVSVAGGTVVLAIFAALLTAIPSFLIGPLSLTGLMAPHLARLVGFHRVNHQLAASLLIGASLLVAADWLSRMVIFPYEIPVGLFAALIGGPYVIWLLTAKEIPQ